MPSLPPASATLVMEMTIDRAPFDQALRRARVSAYAPGEFVEQESFMGAGEMGYLEARNSSGELKRASLANAAPWARSVVVCALNYNSDAPYSTHSGSTSQGWISRYAFTERDYHDAVLAKLDKGHTRA